MRAHREVLELLPWFINGTLHEQEQSMVNDHLAECSECMQQVGLLIETSKVFQATSDPSVDSIVQARRKFLQKLPGDRACIIHQRMRRWVIPATMAACLLIAALFLSPMSDQQQSFETRSNNVPHDSVVIQLVFQPDTPEMSIQNLVLANQAHIISGPTAQGVYRLELSPDSNSQQVLTGLLNQDEVKFAELETNP